MILEELKKAEEIRKQIVKLEKFINYRPTLFERFLIMKKISKPKFMLGIESYFLGDITMDVTSEALSDAIKKALEQTIEDLKGQLVELGVEVE